MKFTLLLRATFLLGATAALFQANQGRAQVAINSDNWGLVEGDTSGMVVISYGSSGATSTTIAGYGSLVNSQNLKLVAYDGAADVWQSTGLISDPTISKRRFQVINLQLSANVLPEPPSYALGMAALTFLGVAYGRARQQA